MKLEKKISLHAFEVEYTDQREAKPRTLHRESIVLDGGRMNTLDHLNQTPQNWIRQQYAQQGYTVAAIHKGDSLTAKVDTGFLWKLAALDAAATSPLPCPQPVSRRQRPPVDLSPRAARCSTAAPESGNHAEHAQGTVKSPPGWQRAFQALSLPSHPGKF